MTPMNTNFQRSSPALGTGRLLRPGRLTGLVLPSVLVVGLPLLPGLPAAPLLTPAPLAAQVGPAQSPEARMQAALTQAAERGIPAELLESKIAEGRAKGVPADRIAQATEQRLAGLMRARSAMADAPGGVDGVQLGVGADALAAGVSEALLAELAVNSPAEQRAVAVAALAYLVEVGSVPEHALARVREALARGPAALADLPGAAAPPFGTAVPARRGPPDGVQTGPPAAVPTPGRTGPPVPPRGGSPSGPPAGPPTGPPAGPPSGPPSGPPGGGSG